MIKRRQCVLRLQALHDVRLVQPKVSLRLAQRLVRLGGLQSFSRQ